ncbi:ABC transporter ATP-binding protein [Dietzia cinnamea]|uniref:ABC transporter ATP-binding protein n=1 Tax=Dietzia cinnamea TaxID=321318 RepID=UPI0021A2CC9B|nr:ABC transporter ATP-binding protein [Dietzia cinnamea]MCT1711974.1 ABC transporter ATP-binding protein [Dietzia cinnamea]
MSPADHARRAPSSPAAPRHPALACRDLHVVRDRTPVLHGIDLSVPAGSWVSLVGPNGSGKTTLLFALAGLVPASGGVEVEGFAPRRAGRRRVARTVAMMPQRPVVPEGVTARELIRLGRTPHISRFGTETAHDHEVVDRVIDRLDLRDLAARTATTLSGGELQRVVLARSLAQEPRVLLLDEPTSALDIGHQQQVLDLVDSMRRESGLTVVAAMHDLTSAAHYGERLVLLDGGRVVADGRPEEVLTAERVAQVYGARVEVLERPDGPAVLPLRGAGAGPGEEGAPGRRTPGECAP